MAANIGSVTSYLCSFHAKNNFSAVRDVTQGVFHLLLLRFLAGFPRRRHFGALGTGNKSVHVDVLLISPVYNVSKPLSDHI